MSTHLLLTEMAPPICWNYNISTDLRIFISFKTYEEICAPHSHDPEVLMSNANGWCCKSNTLSWADPALNFLLCPLNHIITSLEQNFPCSPHRCRHLVSDRRCRHVHTCRFRKVWTAAHQPVDYIDGWNWDCFWCGWHDFDQRRSLQVRKCLPFSLSREFDAQRISK